MRSPSRQPTGIRHGSPEQVFAAWLAERDAFEAVIAAHPEQAARLRVLHDRWTELEPVLRLAGLDHAAPASFAERLKATHGEVADPAVSPDTPETKGTSDLLRRLTRKTTGARYSLEGEIARDGMGAILRVGTRTSAAISRRR